MRMVKPMNIFSTERVTGNSMFRTAMIGTLAILTTASLLPAAGLSGGGDAYVYVAPNLIQSRSHGIFSTLALTNTTEYWFNPRIYLVDADGRIVQEFSPLLKGFGTWQKTTVDFLPEDFNGSVWIVSSQPIVASSFMHQLREDGSLSLLGNTELRGLEPAAGTAAAQGLTGSR